jgi:hypothetical protein
MPTHHLTDRSKGPIGPAIICANFDRGSAQLNLNEIISERAALYRRLCGPAITLDMRLATDLDPVFSRPIDLDRLLLNVIMYARFSMPFGGHLELTTSNVSSHDSLQKRSVRLRMEVLRNSPENRRSLDQPRYWDPKLAQSFMERVVLANGGMLTTCQLSELVSTTEILLPSSREHE